MDEYIDYQEYLKSPEWKANRRIFLQFWNHSCALCCSSMDLQVHHRIYDRLGTEKITDVIVLCGRHHAQFHGKDYIAGRTDTIQNVLNKLSNTVKAGIAK